jgi:hypothetical protein
MRDIDTIISALLGLHPQIKVEQLQVKYAADDDGLWFFSHPESPFEVQLESPYGVCPFLFETNEHGRRFEANTCDEAVLLVERGLGLKR